MLAVKSSESETDNTPAFELSAADERSLTPEKIVAELDRYIIAQDEAKRAVAIALRNRWRRLQLSDEMREEITPKNIIMIGPTGVGKTEISRRLAKLTNAPFVKVEASKFTEVGYVGRDVESIIRDLVEVAQALVKREQREQVRQKAESIAEEQVLDILLPHGPHTPGEGSEAPDPSEHTRDRLRAMLRKGALDERLVEIEVHKPVSTHLEILGPPGFAEVEGQLKDMFTNMIPKGKERRKLSVKEARAVLTEEAQDSLLDPEQISRLAVRRAEQTGIVFIDEIDKICARETASKGPDVSREGVQRDLLPIVEGSTVSTKYGPVKTDHVLFIASGAFHHVKPSDLMPEFQGRFPIRVELKSLDAEHFVRILTEPKNALIKQYAALLATEGVTLTFEPESIAEIARLTAAVNSRTENIGARRLHTLLEKLLEDLLFDADTRGGSSVSISPSYVLNRLAAIVKDEDLARFIL